MKKLGLVFGGGGGKGSYQIGVWRALRKLGLENRVQVVSGTSIGSLNGALFIKGDLCQAENLWMSIAKDEFMTSEDIIKQISGLIESEISNLIYSILPSSPKTGFGWAGGLRLLGKVALAAVNLMLSRAIIRQELIDKLIRSEVQSTFMTKLGVEFYICSSESALSILSDTQQQLAAVFANTAMNRPFGNCRYFGAHRAESIDSLHQNLLASTCLPIPDLYKPVRIDGKSYLDGGLVDNVPLKPVIDAGCDAIITVQLNEQEIISTLDVAKDAGECRIVNIKPSASLGGVFDGNMDFSSEGKLNRMRLGYEDTMTIMGRQKAFS